ncbi:formate dehydrogenase accessory protein FdhE [Glaciimonas sp. PAMC28666]|uniref:formate dehydrogenase accessory protein FdhE n=1 Tax=Glaciimonas sp. PAMC28666 TaxID=2807626 RepID=UPI00196323FE|nr:formate dehydrogenase accessory protein FdhE [Glaciimonas sp. PAMC28666]QRX82589.1 formate dehydrogenase accessory protein FdhE [Glaciimonas sp. PAMC28666]
MQRILERGEIESLDHITIPRLRLPPSDGVFKARAARLRKLAANEIAGTPVSTELSGYLLLMADVVEAQDAVFASLTDADAALPDQNMLEMARQHAMPPLPLAGARPLAWHAIFARLLTSLAPSAKSRPQLVPVLAALQALDTASLDTFADAVLNQRIEEVDPAHAPFIAAALQILWTHRASKLMLQDVPTLETAALCPVCGSHPVASVVRIGGQSQGYRYLHCELCASEWHMVRVKCSHCEKNANIAYQGLRSRDTEMDAEIDAKKVSAPLKANKANDAQKVIRAETCDDCHTYRKIVNQEHDYEVEPLADDLASLMLDVLVTEAGYNRASMNPLLWFSGPA